MNSNNNSAMVNGLTSMRQSQNSEGIQSLDSSTEITDIDGQSANALLNLDISASKFMKVMNFEAMKGSSSDVYEDEYGTNIDQYDEEESLDQHSMDMSMEIQNDLIEQQQAMEQAKLLHRFKEFTNWQQQQQKLLMAQQQQELLQLRGEQERVQRMIEQQRQLQLGTTHQDQDKSIRSPPRTKHWTSKTTTSLRHSNDMIYNPHPQGLPAGLNTMANRHGNAATKESIPASSTPQKMNGRPAPVLPDRPPTPDEYREMGNPNLDSDTNTVSSGFGITEDDGVRSTPDNISDLVSSRLQNSQSYIPGYNGFSQNGFGPTSTKLYEDTPQPTFPTNGLFGQAQQMQMQLLNQLAAQSGLALPYQFMPREQLPPSAFNLPSLNTRQQQPRALQPNFLHNLRSKRTMLSTEDDSSHLGHYSNHHPPSANGFEVQDELLLEKSKFSASRKQSLPKDMKTRLRPSSGQPLQSAEDVHTFNESAEFMEEKIGEPEDSDQWEDEHIDSDEQVHSIDEHDDTVQELVNDDDRPIGGIAAKKKTFEQLLEEEMRKEEERMKGGDCANIQVENNLGKRPFLRRGDGIARFTLPNSAKTRSVRNMKVVQRASHSAPSGGRSERKPTMSATTPTTSNTEKNSSGPRRLANSNKTVKRSNTNGGLQNMSTVDKVDIRKPFPPSEPKKNMTRAPLKKSTSPKQCASVREHQAGHTDSMGDVSFQKRITKKVQEEECDAEELEEFEILEELADDDVSFVSNVSTVNKVVSQLKETRNLGTMDNHIKQQIHKPKQADIKQNIQILQQLKQRKQKQQELAALNTKLKSLTIPLTNNTNGALSSKKVQDGLDTDSSDDENESARNPQEKPIPQRKVVSLTTRSSNEVSKPRDTESLVVSFGSNPVNHDVLQNVPELNESDGELSTDYGEDSNKDESDQEESDSEEDDSFVIKDVHLHAKNHDTNDNNNNEGARNDNVNNRVSAATTGSESSHSSNVLEAHSNSNSTRGPSPVSNKLDSSAGSGTLKLEHSNRPCVNGQGDNAGVKPVVLSNGFEFEDEEEWGDFSQIEEGNTTLTDSKTMPSVASPKSVTSQPQSATPPPTSKLVSRLFPNLKQEANKQQKNEKVFQQQKVEVTKQTNANDGIQSKMLRDKLMELETEIERFRNENADLARLRKERAEGLSKLHKEMEEFEKQKEAELKRLNDFKTEETKKLKKERKLFDQYQKAARAVPDKKEREEIENLKKQVSDLQEEMKRKEQRWTSSTTRLRDRIETLETENEELKGEIKILEKKRLESWQQKEAEKKSILTNSKLPLKKEDSRQAALAPTPQLQPTKATDRDNALRLSSNTEELRAALGGFSLKELDDSVMSTEAEEHDQSLEFKQSPTKNSEAKPIPRKKAQAFSISNTVDRGDGEYKDNTLPDGKIEKVYTNGSREIIFPNGTKKQISSDGQSVIVSFFNGDVKQIMSDQRVVYYYSEAQTTHTSYPDGLEIIQFPNNQVEKHYPDGTREISFPDNTIKYLFPSGMEESIFEDGTVIRVEKSGDKTMEFPNGQREVHSADYKRREYPDGTVKTVYPDGKQETRYSSGRIRVKDRDGNIIVDKRV